MCRIALLLLLASCSSRHLAPDFELKGAVYRESRSGPKPISARQAFAVGICDGKEVRHGLAGGDEFFVLARGRDGIGAETYYESGEKGSSPRILRYRDVAGDPEEDLIFRFVSREAQAQVPARCR